MAFFVYGCGFGTQKEAIFNALSHLSDSKRMSLRLHRHQNHCLFWILASTQLASLIVKATT
eukprot:scaffold4247_cov66-Cylindrotheca_fusiformis.AAC.7